MSPASSAADRRTPDPLARPGPSPVAAPGGLGDPPVPGVRGRGRHDHAAGLTRGTLAAALGRLLWLAMIKQAAAAAGG